MSDPLASAFAEIRAIERVDDLRKQVLELTELMSTIVTSYTKCIKDMTQIAGVLTETSENLLQLRKEFNQHRADTGL